jgi:hypothetical protein
MRKIVQKNKISIMKLSARRGLECRILHHLSQTSGKLGSTAQSASICLLLQNLLTSLKYRIFRSALIHVLAHFQRITCSQIYFHFSSYLLRKPLLIRSTAFICNIDRDWMIYRKHPIRSLLTSMLRKANMRYPSDVYALSFDKYKGK